MHCINVALIKKSEIRNSIISSIVDNENYDPTKSFLNLPQDILMFPDVSNKDIYDMFGSIEFVRATTDYFGGGGEQSALLYRSKIDGVDVIETSYSFSAINIILKSYGVTTSSKEDEFDAIDLGRYRSNEDINNEILKRNVVKKTIKNIKDF